MFVENDSMSFQQNISNFLSSPTGSRNDTPVKSPFSKALQPLDANLLHMRISEQSSELSSISEENTSANLFDFFPTKGENESISSNHKTKKVIDKNFNDTHGSDSYYDDSWKDKYVKLNRDTQEYKQQIAEMQKGGNELYTAYQLQCEKIQKNEDKFDELKSAAYSLEAENKKTVDQYNNLWQAYEELAAWAKEAKEKMTEKEKEIEHLQSQRNTTRKIDKMAIESEECPNTLESQFKWRMKLIKHELHAHFKATLKYKHVTKSLRVQLNKKEHLCQQLEKINTQQLEKIATVSKEKDELAEFIQNEETVTGDLTNELQFNILFLKKKLENEENSHLLLRAKVESNQICEQKAKEDIRIKEKAINDWKIERHQIKEQIQMKNQEVQTLQKKLSESQQTYASRCKAKEKIKQSATEIEQLKNALNEEKQSKISLKQDLNITKINLLKHVEKLDKVTKANIANRKNMGEYKALIERQQNDIEKQKQQIKSLSCNLKMSEHKTNCFKEQTDNLHQMLQETKNAMVNLEREKAAKEFELQQSQTLLKKCQQSVDLSNTREAEYREKSLTLKKKNNFIKEKMKQLNRKMDNQRVALMQAQTKYERENAQLQEKKKEYLAISKNFSIAKNSIVQLKKENMHKQERLDMLLRNCDKKTSNFFLKLMMSKQKVESDLRDALLKQKENMAKKQELRKYLIIFKEKADERYTIANATMKEQTLNITKLRSQLRHIELVLVRYRSIIASQPELAALLENIKKINNTDSYQYHTPQNKNHNQEHTNELRSIPS